MVIYTIELATSLSIVGLAVSITSAIISFISEIVCANMTSKFSIEKMEFYNYLINVRAGFEVGRGSSNQEVVMLKFRYHFGDNTKGTYFDYSPRYKDYGNNLYNKTYIDCFDDSSCFSGTINGCKSYDELKGFLS